MRWGWSIQAAALQAGVCCREVLVSAAANGKADVQHRGSSAASTRAWVLLCGCTNRRKWDLYGSDKGD